jgi:hypothetical protein
VRAVTTEELQELWGSYPTDKRTEKAASLLEYVDPEIIEHEGRIMAFVKDYAVTIEPEIRRCECPDHIYRRLDCKHIRAAVLYLLKNGEGGNVWKRKPTDIRCPKCHRAAPEGFCVVHGDVTPTYERFKLPFHLEAGQPRP